MKTKKFEKRNVDLLFMIETIHDKLFDKQNEIVWIVFYSVFYSV